MDIHGFYHDVNEMLAGRPDKFLARWEQSAEVSTFMALGEREHGWEGVSRLFRQVSHIVGSSPAATLVVPESVHTLEGSDMGVTTALEKVEAKIPGHHPEGHHYQRGTIVWRKHGEHWKVVHYHSDAIHPVQETLSFLLRHPHFQI